VRVLNEKRLLGLDVLEHGGEGGVGRGDLVEEAAPVVNHDGLRLTDLLSAADAEVNGVTPRLQRGQGPREAPLHPSVGLVEAPIQLGDLVEDELGVERTYGDEYRTQDRCLSY
jgi:hypothetical protein